MRDFCRAYDDAPEVIAEAMAIGWTQNMAILEGCESLEKRAWYIRAVQRFGWTKAELLDKIQAGAYRESTLDLEGEICYTEENAAEKEALRYEAAQDTQRDGIGSAGSGSRISSVLCLFDSRLFCGGMYLQPLLVRQRCGWAVGVAELARRGEAAYGKLFSRKAGLVSRAWYPDLANYRRDGYDFDARYEDGLASRREKRLMDVLLQEGPTLSKDLKRLAGFGKSGLKGFDTAITNLQMQTYVTVHSFEYLRDKHGKPYGWGVARYAVAEDVLGAEVTQSAYDRSPEESKARILEHLRQLWPGVSEDDLEKLIR